MSLGRGTYEPFQMYGYPDPKFGDFTFTPVSIDGMSKTPPHQDKLCYGVDLRGESLDHHFTLKYILDAYQKSGMKEDFFNNFFNTLAGTDELKKTDCGRKKRVGNPRKLEGRIGRFQSDEISLFVI